MSKRTVRMNKKGNADNQEDLQRTMENNVNFTKLAADLAETDKKFYSRGWVWGTSGNFGAVTSWDALHLAISSTGFDKGILTPAHFLEIDGIPNVIRGDGRPSTETLVHLAIVRCVNAGAVLHTHSVSSTGPFLYVRI